MTDQPGVPAQPHADEDAFYAAYVGSQWEKVYRRKFARFRARSTEAFTPSWNWAAAFWPGWFLHWRLRLGLAPLVVVLFAVWMQLLQQQVAPLVALISVFLTVSAATPLHVALAFLSHASLGVLCLAVVLVNGVMADWLLYRRARAAAATYLAQQAAGAVTVTAAARSKKRERIAITLLTVVVSVPYAMFIHNTKAHHCGDLRYLLAGTKELAYNCQMQMELRNVVRAQESYFATHASYAPSTTAMNFSPSPGVTVTIGSATSTGWNATATHRGASKTCGVFIGTAPLPVPGARAGKPTCVYVPVEPPR